MSTGGTGAALGCPAMPGCIRPTDAAVTAETTPVPPIDCCPLTSSHPLFSRIFFGDGLFFGEPALLRERDRLLPDDRLLLWERLLSRRDRLFLFLDRLLFPGDRLFLLAERLFLRALDGGELLEDDADDDALLSRFFRFDLDF